VSDINLRRWIARRDPSYIARRACALGARYGFTSGRARRRVDACVSALAELGCSPTFMVPGRVVEAHAPYLRSLTDRGVELALHGFDHVDFASLSPTAVRLQFERSADAFARAGIPFQGFRCPYLSATDEVFRQLPAELLMYSSNSAVTWPTALPPGSGNSVTRQLASFYATRSADIAISLPFSRHGLIELPCSLPDDIQIYDGFKAGEVGLERAWCRVLETAYARGELQVLMFHPELADRCSAAFGTLLELAQSVRPSVWVTRLVDVARWWQERSRCVVERTVSPDGHNAFTLRGSTRARLVRGTESGTRLVVPDELAPLIGVSPLVTTATRDSLVNLGYLLEDDQPARCVFQLDSDQPVDRALLERLEAHPLMRIARWPDGAGAALCISGDLDALSLADYARRLSLR
jgi:peptidoglycan/xylan/chitin deacetylase (PgdA/CDA1 family)